MTLTSSSMYADNNTILILQTNITLRISNGFLLAMNRGPTLVIIMYTRHIRKLGNGDDIMNQSATRGSEENKNNHKRLFARLVSYFLFLKFSDTLIQINHQFAIELQMT